jgi:hypothetical protein
MTQEKTLRDKYFDNEIFRIGELVEDINTHEHMQIIDRGANYITVATQNGTIKKWLNEIVTVIKAEVVTETAVDKDFVILESGQIKLFGHETKNFDLGLSELLIEQFSEFDDLYSKHQIIKCLDYAIQESNMDDAYNLLEKVEKFYTKTEIHAPFIVESLKNDIERRRIAEIIAAIADIKPVKSNYQTVVMAIKELRSKYPTRKQWEVLWPFLKLAQASGLSGVTQNLPYNFSGTTNNVHEETEEDITIDVMEDNVDLMVEELELDDIFEAFDESEFTGELLSEVLSIEDRTKLGRKMSQHSNVLGIKRERALSKGASTNVLLDRARKLAETMVKRRMFHKSASNLTRPEKERFEKGAFKRRGLIAKLAQRLVPKVRALQSARLHHTNTPVAHTHDIATAKIAAQGAS